MISLLSPGEPPAVEIVCANGHSAYFLTCDHAGNRIPEKLGTLGLSAVDRRRHIAWDIGAAGVARRLAVRLDAFLILQAYSRLVIDCNRSPEWPSAIAKISEQTEIPGNLSVSAEEAEARRREIFAPYQDRIAAELDARAAIGRPTILATIHSFTPEYLGVKRPWHVGVLYNRDTRLAHILLDLLRKSGNLVVGDNEPYSVADLSDYTIPVHGERRGIPHVEIEIRQDLIEGEAGQGEWAERLAGLLTLAAGLLTVGI